jgi:voltage-gated potassium channel
LTVAKLDALRGRFTGLAVVLLVLLLLASATPPGEIHTLVVDLAFSVLLVFAIRSVGPGLRITAIVLAAPAFLGHWALYLENEVVSRGLVFLSSTAFLLFLTLVVIFAVLGDPVVTTDTVIGGICAYFLLAMTFGNAYALVEVLSPGSFQLTPALAEDVHWRPPTSPITPVLQYFSLSTLTTLGFGDVTPLSRGARTLAVLEAIAGQLYLAILIARLVGIHTSRSSSS